MNNEPTTFIKATRHFFERMPGQTLKDFSEELRALNDQDKQELSDMLRGAGYNIQ